MKVLAVILGFFCLLISSYPCCIDNDCEPNSVEKIAENDNGQENEECSLCSPFINCGTCTGFIPSGEEIVTVSEPQPIAFSNLFGLSFKSVEAEYAERVWQPPKQVIIS